MASNKVLNSATWTFMFCLTYCFVIQILTAVDIRVTAKRSFKGCYHGNAFLNIFNLSLDQCVFECKIRSLCGVMQYWRMRRECELLTSDGVNAMGTFGAAASCVRIRHQEMTSYSGLFDQCQNCPDATVCDIEQGTCTIKECATLKLLNGTVQGNVRSVGAKVTVRCDVGFYVENVNGSVYCLDNGNWSSTPLCVQNIVESCAAPVALVSGAGGVPDSAITASSYWDSSLTPAKGRLDQNSGWAPETRSSAEYWQVEFPSQVTVVGITTQGYEYNQVHKWVSTFTVYSSDGICSSSAPVLDVNGNMEVFPGNSDRDTHVNNTFYEVVHASCIRVYPQTWYNFPIMRVELWGCP